MYLGIWGVRRRLSLTKPIISSRLEGIGGFRGLLNPPYILEPTNQGGGTGSKHTVPS